MNKDLEITEVPVDFHQDGVSIKLPLEFAQYLKLSKRGKYKGCYLIPTNGLIQISAGKVFTTIPALTESNLDFMSQD